MSNVQIAADLGRKAFHDDKMAVPALDVEFCKFMSGKTNILELLTAWTEAWHAENMKAPV
jgi:hypothetical protein